MNKDKLNIVINGKQVGENNHTFGEMCANSDGTVNYYLSTTDSTNILSRPVTILITYKE